MIVLYYVIVIINNQVKTNLSLEHIQKEIRAIKNNHTCIGQKILERNWTKNE